MKNSLKDLEREFFELPMTGGHPYVSADLFCRWQGLEEVFKPSITLDGRFSLDDLINLGELASKAKAEINHANTH